MISPERLKRLKELLNDAEMCPRLNKYEEDFCASMRERVEQRGENMNLSDAQERVLTSIEAKVYA